MISTMTLPPPPPPAAAPSRSLRLLETALYILAGLILVLGLVGAISLISSAN